MYPPFRKERNGMRNEDKESVFSSSSAKIYWGDSIDVLQNHIPDSSIDLIFADPPYNIGKQFNNTFDRWPSDEKYAEWCYLMVNVMCKKTQAQWQHVYHDEHSSNAVFGFISQETHQRTFKNSMEV